MKVFGELALVELIVCLFFVSLARELVEAAMVLTRLDRGEAALDVARTGFFD
jgi:hypothetical protein